MRKPFAPRAIFLQPAAQPAIAGQVVFHHLDQHFALLQQHRFQVQPAGFNAHDRVLRAA